jgi:hypothetical protein
MIEQGKVDTTFLISHHASLENGPEMYKHWHDDQNSYTKIVLKTAMAKGQIEETRTPAQEIIHREHSNREMADAAA